MRVRILCGLLLLFCSCSKTYDVMEETTTPAPAGKSASGFTRYI